MSGGLTTRQAEAYAFIVGYIAKHDGVSPSYDEIGAALHLSTRSSVHRVLTLLRDHGRIEWVPHWSRSITVISAASPYATDVLCALPTATLEAIAAVVGTELACRVRDAVLAFPEGSCPAMEGRG